MTSIRQGVLPQRGWHYHSTGHGSVSASAPQLRFGCSSILGAYRRV